MQLFLFGLSLAQEVPAALSLKEPFESCPLFGAGIQYFDPILDGLPGKLKFIIPVFADPMNECLFTHLTGICTPQFGRVRLLPLEEHIGL